MYGEGGGERVRDYVTLASSWLNEYSSDPNMAAAFYTLHRVAAKG
jgi:hypothetical protein